VLSGNVLLTGGSGFLGRGILRRARREGWPARFTIFSRDELRQELCREKYPDADYVLGDVTDYDLLYDTCKGKSLVIHAGAMKYIPEAEHNVYECIKSNVQGSVNVIKAADRAGVQDVVGISTDKAAQPINVYGMTKALMERLFGDAHSLGTRYTLVRYGNVVGSTGSVIPLFQKQMQTQGYVTITDPYMTRFWISIDEAIDLILAAAAFATPAGSTIIPIAAAMEMRDLARAIAGDQVKVIGNRGGEKKHEVLITQEESVRVVSHYSYYELLKMGAPAQQQEPFVLSSSAPHVWLSEDRLSDMMKDAACV
jgi:UDP-N-acetylglucosamine 4,6-dehydratase